MPYDYNVEREKLFSPTGLSDFVKVRDRAKILLDEAGAFRVDKIFTNMTIDTWRALACIDMMVEREELRYVLIGSPFQESVVTAGVIQL